MFHFTLHTITGPLCSNGEQFEKYVFSVAFVLKNWSTPRLKFSHCFRYLVVKTKISTPHPCMVLNRLRANMQSDVDLMKTNDKWDAVGYGKRQICEWQVYLVVSQTIKFSSEHQGDGGP